MYKYTVSVGYSARKTTVITDRALKGHNSMQAGIIIRGDGYLLMSYNTPAAFISLDGDIECMCLCSATTRKHVSLFAREFNKTYADFKAAYGK